MSVSVPRPIDTGRCGSSPDGPLASTGPAGETGVHSRGSRGEQRGLLAIAPREADDPSASLSRPSPSAFLAVLSSSCLVWHWADGCRASTALPPDPAGTTRVRKLFVVGSVVVGWLGLMAAWSSPRVQSVPPPTREGAEQRPLDPETIAVRLLLGVGDPRPRAWNGRVKVDRGEVVGVEGWRFRGHGPRDRPRRLGGAEPTS